MLIVGIAPFELSGPAMAVDTEGAKVLWVQQMTQHGLLDDQFDQLLQLQQEDSPGFLQEIITLFFTDSSSKFAKLDQLLARQPVSFQEVDQTVHQLKGSSASLGARQVADLCVQVILRCRACSCLMPCSASFD